MWLSRDDHWDSLYSVDGSGPSFRFRGYNATGETDQALEFIERRADEPFFLLLSWHPPHARYTDAPDWAQLPDGALRPRANLEPGPDAPEPEEYRGYHAHIRAIDREVGRVLAKLSELGIADDTIVVYTSDHGSMMGSHGLGGKRLPYDESIRVPFLVRWPGGVPAAESSDALLGTIDVMPTILGLAGLPVPESADGVDRSTLLRKPGEGAEPASAFLLHVEFEKARRRGHEKAPIFRGVRTARYTLAVREQGPWLFFDNREDPLQQRNAIDDEALAEPRRHLTALLSAWLRRAGDPFVLPQP